MFNRLITVLHDKILTEDLNCFMNGKCIKTAVQMFIEVNSGSFR